MAEGDFNVKAIISADTKNFDKGMKQAQTSANNLSNTFSNVSKMITKALSFAGLAIGTKAIVDFTKSCVQGATESVKQFNILDNTIKATGADAWTSISKMDEMSKALSDSTNYSVTEIQKMQSVLLGFSNITDKTFNEASEAVLDMATVMGMDLTSAVQTVGKALDDPIKGLDSLRRQGFKFTDEQKAELAQLVANGKQVEAQKIILDSLSMSYGGAATAGQDSFAKQRHAVENFKDTLGAKLIPTVQIFASTSANTLNKLTAMLEKLDFNKIAVPVKVVFDLLRELFDSAKNKLIDFGNIIKTSFNFQYIERVIPIFDTLLAVINKIGEAGKSQLGVVSEAMGKLKDTLVNMTANIDFEKVKSAVDIIAGAFIWLKDELSSIFENIYENIKIEFQNIYDVVVGALKDGQDTLTKSESDVKSWGDAIFKIFDGGFKNVQNLVGMIKNIINGNWKAVWEYAKLIVLRFADTIMDAISTLMNAFPKQMNKFGAEINKWIERINKAREFIGMAPLELVPEFKKIDLSGITGVEDKIKEVQNNIKELTGALPEAINLKDLKNYVSGSTGLFSKFSEKLSAVSKKAKKDLGGVGGGFTYTSPTTQEGDTGGKLYKVQTEWDTKLLQQKLSNLKAYSKEYHKIQKSLIEAERAKAKGTSDTESERAKVNAYYDNEIKKENERMLAANITATKEAAQKISGITKQSADRIKTIMSGIIKFVSVGIQGVSNIIKKTFDILSRLSSSVFSKVKSGLSTLFKIDLSATIDSLLEFEDAILTFFVETLPQLPALLNTVFSSVHQTLGSVNLDVNAIIKILKTALDTFISYAPAIVNDVLRLLASFFEGLDSFVSRNGYELIQSVGEMAKKIADAVPGIIETISHTLDTLIRLADNYLQDNKNTLLSTLSSLADALTSSVPSIFNSFINIAGRIVELVIQTLRNKTDDIVGAIGSIVSNLFSLMSSLLPQILELAGKFIVSIASYISGNAQGIQSGVQALITSIMKTIQDFISGGGVATVLKSVMKIVELVCNIVTGNATEIANQFVEVLPAIFDALKKALPAIIGALKSILSPMLKMTFSLIVEIMELLLNRDMLDSIIELVVELVHQILTEFVPAFMRLLPKIIPALIEVFAKSIPELVWGIVSGLVQGLINTNWVQLAKDIWKGFIDSFKSLFGIHSPSTLFADFGVNIIQGLWNGMKSMGTWLWDNCKSFFNTMVESIKGVFSDIGSWFKSTFTTAYNNMTSAFANAKTWFSNLFSNISSASKSFASSLKENMSGAATSIKNTASSAFSSVVSGVKSLGSKVASFFGFANGTNSAPRGLALVGEAGPELVRFRGGEQVINNKNTQKLLADSSNGSNIFNVTFNNTVDTTAYAMIRELQSYQRNLAFNGVL